MPQPDKTFTFDPVQETWDRDDAALEAAQLEETIADAIIDSLPASALHALCEQA
jgi:hypothetical protein